jgi:FkbM family methyltransferase
MLCAWEGKTTVREIARRSSKPLQVLQIGSNDGVANDPINEALRARGWSGVLVEPIPYLFERLMANYDGVPGVRFANVAIAGESGHTTIYTVDPMPADPDWVTQIASLDRDVILRHANEITDLDARIVPLEVESLRLETLVDRFGLSAIDLLHIDAEGFDHEIIRQIGFNKPWAPRFILFEIKHMDLGNFRRTKLRLKNAGYRLVNMWPDALAYRVGPTRAPQLSYGSESNDEGHLPEEIERALETHRRQTEAALASNDPAEIKRLYVELGDLLDNAIGEADPGSAPVLSLPETGPVVLALLDRVRGMILDAGCGPNPAMSLALARDPARTVVGMDIGFGIVRIARAIAARAGTRFLPIVADLEALPFRAGAFDGCVCDDTVEHLPDDARGVAELGRVMKTRGRAVLATPNRRSLAVLVRKAHDRIRGTQRPASAYYAATSHLREYSWPQFEQLISPSFRIMSRASVGWSGGWKKRLASRLTGIAILRPLSRMIVVAVEPRGDR